MVTPPLSTDLRALSLVAWLPGAEAPALGALALGLTLGLAPGLAADEAPGVAGATSDSALFCGTAGSPSTLAPGCASAVADAQHKAKVKRNFFIGRFSLK